MLATFCQTAKLSPIQFGSRNYLSLASFAILVLVFHPVWQSYISMFGNIYIHIQYIHTPLELTNLGGGCVSSYLLICVNRESIGCQTRCQNIRICNAHDVQHIKKRQNAIWRKSGYGKIYLSWVRIFGSS